MAANTPDEVARMDRAIDYMAQATGALARSVPLLADAIVNANGQRDVPLLAVDIRDYATLLAEAARAADMAASILEGKDPR